MAVEALPDAAAADAASLARRHRRRHKVLTYIGLTVGAVVVLFPLYMTVVGALIEPTQLTAQPPAFFPLHPQWSDFSKAWNEGNLGVYLRNSVIATLIITAGQVVTSVVSGYAFAFLRFPFKRILFALFMATLMIPFEVTIITNLHTLSQTFHWYNTFQGLTVPFLATGFGTFLLRQSFLQIPRDLRESARLDGYGHWRFLVRVAVPLTRPAIAALAVFSFLGAWNQYLWPLLITGNNNAIRTVTIGLKQLQATDVQQLPITLAGTVIAIVPLLILLIVFQKQLVRGLTAGAVK